VKGRKKRKDSGQWNIQASERVSQRVLSHKEGNQRGRGTRRGAGEDRSPRGKNYRPGSGGGTETLFFFPPRRTNKAKGGESNTGRPAKDQVKSDLGRIAANAEKFEKSRFLGQDRPTQKDQSTEGKLGGRLIGGWGIHAVRKRQTYQACPTERV